MGYNILLVDDEPELLNLYKMAIERNKKLCVIDCAEDGRSAVEKYKNSNDKIHLVIMDHRMPSMNGIEAAKEIIKRDSQAKIIFISADTGIKDEAIKAGALAFLPKPIRMSVLLENIDLILRYAA